MKTSETQQKNAGPRKLIASRPEFDAHSGPSGKEEGEGWVVSFLDMMILVLTFFVAFIATQMPNPINMTGQDKGPEATPAGAMTTPEGNTAIISIIEPEARIDQFAKDQRVTINRSTDGVTMTIDDRFLFASGSADISLEGSDTIEDLMPLLEQLPGKIEVVGHTDNIPIRTRRFDTNWELSAARAVNIVRLLIHQGINEERLEAVGVAHTQPIAPNTTETGRRKNRRVEIQIREQE